MQSIVEMHGGRVAVESRIGEGSRFTVTLPRDPRAIAGTPAEAGADVPAAPRPDPANVTETSPSLAPQVNADGPP